MNAETLAAMPEGARFAIKVALIEELRKSRTIRPAIFSLVAYDVLTTLPKERQVIWSKKPTFVTLLYLICRYGFILAQMGNLYLERAGLSAGACQKSIRSLNVPPVIVFIAGSTLFIQRLYALFDNNKKVSIPLYVLLAGSVAVQLLAIIDMKANPLPSLLSLRACTPGGHNEYFLGFHLSILGFHGVVVVATCAKIWMLFKQSDSHLLRIVLRDSLFWFVIVTLGSTANLIYYLRTPEGKNRALLAALASGFDSIAPARMLLNLRSAANGNNLSGSGLPVDSTVVSLPLTPTVPTYSRESPVAAIASPSTSHTYLAPPRSPIAMPSVKAVADRRSRLF